MDRSEEPPQKQCYNAVPKTTSRSQQAEASAAQG